MTNTANASQVQSTAGEQEPEIHPLDLWASDPVKYHGMVDDMTAPETAGDEEDDLGEQAGSGDLKVGRVDEVFFTSGSPLGNQYTTIDGIQYYTWFDLREVKVHRGVRVVYTTRACESSVNGRTIHYVRADILRVLPKDAASDGA